MPVGADRRIIRANHWVTIVMWTIAMVIAQVSAMVMIAAEDTDGIGNMAVMVDVNADTDACPGDDRKQRQQGAQAEYNERSAYLARARGSGSWRARIHTCGTLFQWRGSTTERVFRV